VVRIYRSLIVGCQSDGGYAAHHELQSNESNALKKIAVIEFICDYKYCNQDCTWM